MKPITSLFWKEWHEVRTFLWIALGTFILLPLIGSVEWMIEYKRHYEFSAAPWVLVFGGVLAIFVAVGATCRDFTARLEDFWQSQPVSLNRWMLVKYLTGLAVVLSACVLPLAIQYLVSSDREMEFLPLIAWFTSYWAALFSIGFMFGCLVRRTSHAAMLGLAAMLLLYFLPIVLPPLRWMSLAFVEDPLHAHGQIPRFLEVRPMAFTAGMTALTAAALALGLLAVNRNWRIRSGQKVMYGAISLAILLLFASAAFQMGTNMPILQQTQLPPGEYAGRILWEGDHGIVVTRIFDTLSDDQNDIEYRPFELTQSGIQLGAPQRSNTNIFWQWFAGVSPAGNPEISYRAGENTSPDGNSEICSLGVSTPEKFFVVPLWARPIKKSAGPYRDWPLTYAWKDRLYVIGQKLVILDISQPRQPRIISNAPCKYVFRFGNETAPGYFLATGDPGGDLDNYVVNLPPVPGLPPPQRLEAVINELRLAGGCAFDGRIFCQSFAGTLVAYRLSKPTDSTATLQRIGQYTPTILESIFGRDNFFDLQTENGLLYVSNANYSWGWNQRYAAHQGPNPHITVFDLRGDQPLRLIGHFAAPGVGVVCPLPDGRALVGGSHLWLVGPPPHRSGD